MVWGFALDLLGSACRAHVAWQWRDGSWGPCKCRGSLCDRELAEKGGSIWDGLVVACTWMAVGSAPCCKRPCCSVMLARAWQALPKGDRHAQAVGHSQRQALPSCAMLKGAAARVGWGCAGPQNAGGSYGPDRDEGGSGQSRG